MKNKGSNNMGKRERKREREKKQTNKQTKKRIIQPLSKRSLKLWTFSCFVAEEPKEHSTEEEVKEEPDAFEEADMGVAAVAAAALNTTSPATTTDVSAEEATSELEKMEEEQRLNLDFLNLKLRLLQLLVLLYWVEKNKTVSNTLFQS